MSKLRFSRSGFGPAVIVVLSAAGVMLATALGRAAEPAKADPSEPAAKKEYREDPVDQGQRKNGATIAAMARAGQFQPDVPSGQKTVSDYYRKFKLAQHTSTDEKSLSALPEARATALRELKNLARSGGPVYLYIRDDVTLDYLNDIASKPNDKGLYCHPAVRVNAMLLIGELNEKEAFAGSEVPVPLSAAVPKLVAAVESAEQIDAVRVAALAGLYRHVRLGGIATADAKKLVGVAMFKLLKMARPPADRTPEGHAWMRGQAAAILGEIGMAGAKGVVAEAVAATVADDALLFSARCIAARALGKLKYPAPGELDPTPLANALGKLAIDACAAETPPNTFLQQRIIERIAAVSAGLRGDGEQAKGVGPLMTSDAQKKLLADLNKVINDLNKAIKEKDVSGIIEARATLEELLGTGKKETAKDKS
jgi:hypothetical protein